MWSYRSPGCQGVTGGPSAARVVGVPRMWRRRRATAMATTALQVRHRPLEHRPSCSGEGSAGRGSQGRCATRRRYRRARTPSLQPIHPSSGPAPDLNRHQVTGARVRRSPTPPRASPENSTTGPCNLHLYPCDSRTAPRLAPTARHPQLLSFRATRPTNRSDSSPPTRNLVIRARHPFCPTPPDAPPSPPTSTYRLANSLCGDGSTADVAAPPGRRVPRGDAMHLKGH